MDPLLKAAEDRIIYAIYAELERQLLKMYPQLGKDIACTVLSLNDLISIRLTVGISRNYRLMSMRPYEIDLHPELLYEHLSIEDMVRIRGGKSLQGAMLEKLGITQQQVIERHIPTPLPQQPNNEKGILDRLNPFKKREEVKQNAHY
ncbi:hypothetical protein DRP07_00680 [Archaeoglobales archaeon]|nr:MAG: hypothetical protein DRP07_00680 [Archaeoglobales archaeon]